MENNRPGIDGVEFTIVLPKNWPFNNDLIVRKCLRAYKNSYYYEVNDKNRNLIRKLFKYGK